MQISICCTLFNDLLETIIIKGVYLSRNILSESSRHFDDQNKIWPMLAEQGVWAFAQGIDSFQLAQSVYTSICLVKRHRRKHGLLRMV